MPMGTGSAATYDGLLKVVKEFITYGIKPKKINGNLFSIKSDDKLIYWYGDEDKFDIIVELIITADTYIVSLLGKNPDLKGKVPFASSLYADILRDAQHGIVIMSDELLSDEGQDLWKKLISLGHKVSIFDATKPGLSFDTVSKPEDLDAYLKHGDADFKKYRYVLSEDSAVFAKIKSAFIRRKIYEQAGVYNVKISKEN
jgi:hypothetical protein